MSDIWQNRLTGEIILENNDFVIVNDIRAIQQDLKQTLQYFYGEWFLNSTGGIPYYQSILVKDPELNFIQATLQNKILSVNGILELLTFQFDYDNIQRQLSVSFKARSTHGPIDYTKTVIL